ncbi:UNVERIFIED_CONTAM: Endophilin-A1 [Trichonephila clavipes]
MILFILNNLYFNLKFYLKTFLIRRNDAASRPKETYQPKKLHELNIPSLHDDISPQVEYGGNFNGGTVIPSIKARTPVIQQPCAQALYDFEPENDGELGFKEGEVITLTSRVDDNWYEGTIHNRTGLFPVNYVQVLVPLP